MIGYHSEAKGQASRRVAALAARHLITALLFAASCLCYHSSGVFAEFELAREFKKNGPITRVFALLSVSRLSAAPLLHSGSALSGRTSPGFTWASRLINSALSACLHLLISTQRWRRY